MFTRSSFELKVGIFIFIGLVILSIIVFSIGNFYSIKRGYTIDVAFSFANGINKGAPVRYSGVEIGEIQNVSVYFDEKENKPLVKLLSWVSQDIVINEDAKATINTLGLLGEKYLEIVPGTNGARVLKKGDTLRGQDPISTEELTRQTKNILVKLDDMIGTLGGIVSNDETKGSLREIISNMEKMSVDLRDMISDARKGKGTVGRFMTDDKLYNDIDDMILDIKKHPWKLLNKPKDWREQMK